MTSPDADPRGSVIAVCRKAEPGLPKLVVEAVRLVENFGIEGDYHAGALVRHRYLARKDPSRPNRRQVLLADTTILADLERRGLSLTPGMLGENILLDGVSVMRLPVGTRLRAGEACLEVTEVRNPCDQLNGIRAGLRNSVESKAGGDVRHNAGMLAVVIEGGWVKAGDPVTVDR